MPAVFRWPGTCLEMEVFSYIEGSCKRERRHSRPDNLSPAADEKILAREAARTEVSA